MWASPYSEELSCFLKRGDDESGNLNYQILEGDPQKKLKQQEAEAGATKSTNDVALDTKDLALFAKGDTITSILDFLKKHHIRLHRKISLKNCKSLLKKKLTESKQTKWIHRQLEKHYEHTARIKEKLVARGGFLLAKSPSDGGGLHQAPGNKSCISPLPYSFMSFKNGVSCETPELSGDNIHAWKSSMTGETNPIGGEAETETSTRTAGLIIVNETFAAEKPWSAAFPPDLKQKPEVKPAVLPDRKQEEVGKELTTFCSPGVEQEKSMSSGSNGGPSTGRDGDLKEQDDSKEGPESRISQAGKLAGENACVQAVDSNLSASEQLQKKHEQESRRNVVEASCEDVKQQKSLAGLEMPERVRSGVSGGRDICRQKTKVSPTSSSLVPTEIGRYLLFRELVRAMDSFQAAAGAGGGHGDDSWWR